MIDDTETRESGSSLDDVAYLARSDHRVPALVALTDRPRSRSELCELTGVSSSTVRRTLGEFENRRWIRKEGYRYEATTLGETIATGMVDLLDRVDAERTVRDVWHWLPDAVGEFPVETWGDMVVTVAEPDHPYRPVNRFEEILRETSELRYLRPAIALGEPCVEVIWGLVEDGLEVTLIDRPSCHEYFLSTYPERSLAVLAHDNFTVLEHDDLPANGVGLLDDRAAISCYEPESGAVQAFLDTDDDVARNWARAVFADYKAEARPVDPDRYDE